MHAFLFSRHVALVIASWPQALLVPLTMIYTAFPASYSSIVGIPGSKDSSKRSSIDPRSKPSFSSKEETGRERRARGTQFSARLVQVQRDRRNKHAVVAPPNIFIFHSRLLLSASFPPFFSRPIPKGIGIYKEETKPWREKVGRN